MNEPTGATAALSRYANRQLDADHLMLALMQHDGWLVPLQEDAPAPEQLTADTLEMRLRAFTDTEGNLFFNAYSGPEAVEATRLRQQAEGSPDLMGDQFVKLPGWMLFTFEVPGCAYLNLDPHLPHAQHFRAEQFGQLHEWARLVGLDAVLERVLTAPEINAQDVATLLDFDHYHLLTTTVPATPGTEAAEPRLALAPDAQNRVLGAVFTTEMSADLHSQWMYDNGPEGLEITRRRFDGRTLWRILAQLTELDGLVFNCRGPLQPKAFSLGLAQWLGSEATAEPVE
jgi:hypothetical protein